MERKKFMKSIGAGGAFAITFGCLGGCLREELEPLNEIIPTAETSQDSIVETTPESITPTETTPETPTESTLETPIEPAPETNTPPSTLEWSSTLGITKCDTLSHGCFIRPP